MKVDVTMDVREPGTHLVGVTQTIPAAGDGARVFRVPAWVPGSYKIRDFGRHVQDVEATVGGKKAKVFQSGKDAWRVPAGGKPVTLHYAVYCRELTVDTSHVTNDHAHLFPPTIVMYDEHSRSLPHAVKIQKPRGWSVWSGLETDDLDGTLSVAEDYDHLLDCPIEVGPPADYHIDAFTVRGRKHRLVWWKAPDHDGDRIRKDIRAIVDETAKIFGGLPYQHYTFIAHVAMEHGGGLEHRNSTVLGVDPLNLQVDEKIKTKFLPLVTHEFFHTWNIKRMAPAAFTPYELQREVYTDLLWLFEGVTSYYELPIMARAGVVHEDGWGKLAAELLKYYEMALGRKRRSVAEASRLTWSLLYQAHEHNVNRNVSYYTKGLFVGLCLDAHLRMSGVSDGLDAVMKLMWERHGTGEGLPENGFAALVKDATGVDVARQLGRWVNGTQELPIDAAFKTLGWDVKRELPDEKKPHGLGVHFKNGSTTIERIPEDSPAFTVLQPDDELVAADGYKWKGDRFAELAAMKKPGDRIGIAAFREGRLRTFDVPIREMPKEKITIKVRKGDAAATRRRKAWLGAMTD